MKIFTLDELHKISAGKVVCVTCKYDQQTPAVSLCSDCDTPLCGSCGYSYEGKTYCNECYSDRSGKCPNCNRELEPIYENNGFVTPDGPMNTEIAGFKECECKRQFTSDDIKEEN